MLNLYKPFSLTEVQTAYMIGRNSQFELSGISPQTYFEYETALDINRLSKSFQKVIHRHPMLRAVILPEENSKYYKAFLITRLK